MRVPWSEQEIENKEVVEEMFEIVCHKLNNVKNRERNKTEALKCKKVKNLKTYEIQVS